MAVSDPGGVLASPHTVIQRGRAHADDHRALAAIIDDVGAEIVVVGMPLSLDGTVGPAAKAVEAEVEELRQVLEVPVEVYDERFTTVTAERSLGERGVKGRARRRVVDQAAAAVLLQAWLDGPGGSR